jgi:hypothetical protein
VIFISLPLKRPAVGSGHWTITITDGWIARDSVCIHPPFKVAKEGDFECGATPKRPPHRTSMLSLSLLGSDSPSAGGASLESGAVGFLGPGADFLPSISKYFLNVLPVHNSHLQKSSPKQIQIHKRP